MNAARMLVVLAAGAMAVGACAIGAPATRNAPATAPEATVPVAPAPAADESPSRPMATTDHCELPGELAQWRADFCLARVGTDDLIAAGPCLDGEGAVRFRTACAGKRHYKRRLCEVLVTQGSRAGTVDACVADPEAMGPTVRDGGA